MVHTIFPTKVLVLGGDREASLSHGRPRHWVAGKPDGVDLKGVLTKESRLSQIRGVEHDKTLALAIPQNKGLPLASYQFKLLLCSGKAIIST